MTVKQLIEWLQGLPPDIQEGEVTSVVHNRLHTAKRVVAYRSGESAVGKPECGIYVESMGTNFDHSDGFTYPHYIDHGGKTH